MLKVYIVPGWSEDRWHTKRLASAFPADRLQLTTEPSQAQVVIAHSSGCYSLPASGNLRFLLLIGPPYHPDIPIGRRIFQAVIRDIPRQIKSWGIVFWLRIRFHNAIYALIYPLRHIKIWRSIRGTLAIAQEHKAVLIRNTDDKFCGPQIKAHVKQFKHVRYVEMPGLHEDCWFNPDPYVDLLLKELK